MRTSKLFFLLLVLTSCDCTPSSDSNNTVICPPCDLQNCETVEESQLRILTAKGPADGVCEGSNVKVINRGSDYGLNYDACCCMLVPVYPPLQCDPLGPGISMCPAGPPFYKHEQIGGYAIRVGNLVKNSAPEDGCCHNGTSKFLFPPSLSGQSKQLCVCFDPNSHPADAHLPSSSSGTTLPDLGSTSTGYVSSSTPSSDSNSTVICPPCDLQAFETVEENQLRLLTANGPTDGICENSVKVINRGSDYGLDNDACCCMPPADYPPIQCDPIGPGISMCPTGPPFYKSEVLADYAIRAAELVKDTAPEDGCCPDGLSKVLCPLSLSGQSKQLCVCYDPNSHPAGTHPPNSTSGTSLPDLGSTSTGYVVSSTPSSHSSSSVICPPCDLQAFETVEENQLRLLTAKGPPDGICENSVKVINRGSDYGLDNDACCCMPPADYPPIQCDPIGPGISMCPTGPPFYKSELLGDYAIRAAELVKDTAPEDGCCPDGLSKFLCPSFLSGQSKQLCVCYDPNSHPAGTHPPNSTSGTTLPDLGSTSTEYLVSSTPSSHSSSSVICPPCDLQAFETVEENQLKILNATGPTDGACEGSNVKVIYRGSDYSLSNDACCCMPVPAYPPIQCDPLGPGISICPAGPPFYKSELLGDYAIRVGELVKDSAPADGCCADGTSKFIFPPELSGQANSLCVCFDPNSHPADTPAVVCPSCDFQLDETPEQNELKILNATGPADGVCVGSDVKIIYHGIDYGLGNDACCCIPVPQYPPLQCDPLGPGIPMCPTRPKFYPGLTFGEYLDRVGVHKVQHTAPEDGCCPNGTTKFILSPSMLGQSYQLCVCFDPNNPFENIQSYNDY